MAQFFVDKTDVANVATDDDYFDILAGRKTQTKAEIMALTEATRHKFFHWFLEYPEVMSKGGFECILGNPPYKGGTRITKTYGSRFAHYLLSVYPASKGTADLISYFVKRDVHLLGDAGYIGLLSTDSIAKGSTRSSTFEYIHSRGLEFIFVITSMKWPGTANVHVAIFALSKIPFGGDKYLDGQCVKYISTRWDNERLEIAAQPIQQAVKSYNGSKVYGDGFVLPMTHAAEFVTDFPKASEYLKPYLSGEDLNSSPSQTPTRKVIDVNDLSFSELLTLQPILKHLETSVKPYRSQLRSDKAARKFWWKFQRSRPELYQSILSLQRIFVCARTTKYLTVSPCPSTYVYSDKCVIFATDKWPFFAVLQSTIHMIWAWKQAVKMGSSTLQYSTSLCYDTFPFPKFLREGYGLKIEAIEFSNLRTNICNQLQLGFTKLYNQFHNQDLMEDAAQDIDGKSQAQIKKILSKESWNLYNHLQKTEGTISFTEAAGRIQELRRLHVEIDQAVLAAYSWHIETRRWGPAIDLRHDFYEVDYLPENDRVRYTIHPEARKEVLKRLLLLNNEIHEAEERGIPYEELDREKIIAIYRDEISAWLPQPELLHAKTIKYLAYAEDMLPDIGRRDLKEYSPYVAEICKAIENELLQKVFIPFNTDFQEKWAENPDGKQALIQSEVEKAPKIKVLLGKLKKNDVKYTLGQMHFFLNIIWNTKSTTLKNSAILQELRDFASDVYSESFINKETMQDLAALTSIYRNASAHADEKYDGDLKDISQAEAMACRDEVRRLVALMVSE